MFRKMSETELIIREIDDVRMIDIYELTGAKEDPEEGCAAISIFYGGDKHINLCEMDDGFLYLVGRVFEIYGEERGRSKGMLTEDIIMDDKSRQILECGWQSRDESFLEPYYGLEPVDIPEIGFESAEAARFTPLISYMLQGLYLMNGRKLEITGGKNGWRGAGILYGLSNGNRIPFALKITELTEERHSVKINNFMEEGCLLNAVITTQNHSILLEYESEQLDFKGSSLFNLHENGYSERHLAYKEGKKIFADTWGKRGAEKINLSPDEIKLLPWQCDGASYHSLPWGMIFAYKKEITEKNGFSIEENKCCHIYKAAGYSESACWTTVKNPETKICLDTSSVRMQRLLTTEGRMQTYFVPCLGNHSEKYEKYLEDRYFVTESQAISNGGSDSN